MKPALIEAPKERPVMPPELEEAERLRVERKPDEAMRICAKFMDNHLDFVPSLILAANIMMDAERYGAAHPYLVRATQIAPDEPVCWNNLALIYQETGNPDEAQKCFIKALSRNPNYTHALGNLAKLYNDTGQPDKAINCTDRALRIDPKLSQAIYNRGISLLAKGEWEDGWKGYEYNLGRHEGRRERSYGAIPRWTGDKGLTVIVHGEQGIGDEINFASMIPDLQKDANVIIECEPRLEGLFRRSFNCPTYGTRYVKGGLSWPLEHKVDAKIAIGSLGQFYRNSEKDFPGSPYLVADPLRRIQWKAALASLGPKLKVGLTWSGGIRRTFASLRSLDLEDLKPILRQDATFISLQYKDAPEIEAFEKETGIKIHHWPYAVQTKDYDDTAALVSELDLVVTVQQSAVHLAGALGVKTWAMIPKTPLWRYGLTKSSMPWYSSVKLYRQRDKWVETISEVARDLRDLIASK